MAFIIIAYSLITLAWQGITGVPPPWTDWFAAHLLLIVLAAAYLGQSHRVAAYDGVARWRIVTPGRDLGDG
ncbi:MAG TPA: hypothetical protein VFI65_09860 [Streptosporangiaceae bacterium]|nr:hypothetical protein [Streptosporangiaceae bacterium]